MSRGATACRLACLAITVAHAGFAGPARAQGAPADRPVPTIPDRLPPVVRDSLERVRTPLLNRTQAFNVRVPDFTARCGRGRIPAADAARLAACGTEFAGLQALSDSIVREKAVFVQQLDAAVAVGAVAARCADLERQLAMDRRALVRQQRVSELLVGELESWAKASTEAQRSAVMLGVTSLFGSAAKQLQSREASATAFRGVLTRYEGQLRARGIPFEAMQERIERATRGYVAARVQAAAGTAMGAAGDANEVWKYAQTEAGVIARLQSTADSDVKAALDDPAFQRFVQTDATTLDLMRSTMDQLAGTPALAPIAPHYALASFIVDYGYEATKWATSRARILQGASLSDEQLRAVQALSAQMERTVARLHACRATP